MIRRRCAFPVLLAWAAALPAEDRAAPLSVAILWFEDGAATGGAAERHWSYCAGLSVARDLAAVKALRVLFRDRIQCAFRKLALEPGGPIAPPTAQALGELLEARRVVWGTWRREGDAWRLEARALNVGTGELGPEIEASGSSITEASSGLSLRLLGSLGIEPSAEERARMSEEPTRSDVALESLARLHAASLEEEPLVAQEAHARRAIEADPACVGARTALAAVLGTQGKYAEAEAVIREALATKPGHASARRVLATILFFLNRLAEAESELAEAQALEPDGVETLVRLAELHTVRKEREKATACLEKALEIDPVDATIHAKIGRVLADEGKKDQAMTFLREAERLHCGEPNTDQVLFLAYAMLGETRLAVERYEALAAWSRRQGAAPAALEKMGAMVEELKARLTPVPVEAPRPRAYTADEIDAVLREKLSEDERRLVTAPLASSDALRARAAEITRDAPDDLARARALFEALESRSPGEGARRVRTALEALAAWDDPEEAFVCQDFAKLHVAMARGAGLDAFYVNVEKDTEGKPVAHVCAAVFLDGKVLLADVTYRWFGAPHREFQVLDDLEVAALELTQAEGSPGALSRCRAAVKLCPHLQHAWLSLAAELVAAEEWTEARSALDGARRLGSEDWRVYALEACLAAEDGKLDKAELYLRAAALTNPEDPTCRYELGKILQVKHKLAEAREELRAALRCRPDAEIEAKARRRLAQVEEGLAGDAAGVPSEP